MQTPVLYYHPLSSYCQKVLIAIDVLGADVEKRFLNLGDSAEKAAYTALWSLGKMPLLVDRGRPMPETSIIIEYLQRHHASTAAKLIPDDPDSALEVRLWDRILDLYVMTPMQAFTSDLLKPEDARDPAGVSRARETLLTSYGILDRQVKDHSWLASETFSMADCAAAPALFYAITYVPFQTEHTHLTAYFERLTNHPSVALAIDQARPYFRFFPGRAGMSRRFFDPGN